MTLKAVFFDLDGTLLDTSKDLGEALNKVLQKHDLTPLPHSQSRAYVSNGAAALIQLGFGEGLEPERISKLRLELLDFYMDDIASHTYAFPGIEQLIDRLGNAGLSWGIVTNKPSLYTKALLQHMQFNYAPIAVVSPDDVGVGKPNAKPLLHACEIAGCSPKQAIYIGDHLRDVECGHNAGMDTIAVGYGFTNTTDEHLSWQATHCVDHADHIWPIIQTYIA